MEGTAHPRASVAKHPPRSDDRDPGARWTALGHRFLPLLALLALGGGYILPTHAGWGVGLLLLGAIGAWALSKRLPLRIATAAALTLLASAGWNAAHSEVDPPTRLGQLLGFRGAVVRDPVQGRSGPRIFVDLEATAPGEGGDWQRAAGRVYLRVLGHPRPSPGRGDTVVFRARLRSPDGLRNPAGGAFAAYLKRNGVGARASAVWPGSVAFAAPGPNSSPMVRWRRKVSEAIHLAVPGPSGDVLRALTLGDRSGLSPETRESFRRAGTSHLLAISGLHLGILALLLVPLLRQGLARIPRLALSMPVTPLAWALTLPALVSYAALSGFQTSTLRALVMAGLLVIANAFSQPTTTLTLLASTALLLALPRPSVLADAGFHLSVAALAGLFWLAPRMERILAPKQNPLARLTGMSVRVRGIRWLNAILRRIVCPGVAATLTTTPLVLFHFGKSSVLGFLLNPVAVPLVGFSCLPLGLLGVVLHPLWAGGARILWALAGAGIQGLLGMQEALVSRAPMLDIPALESPMATVAAICLLAWLGLILQNKARSLPAKALLVAALIVLVVPSFARWTWARLDPRVHLWMFDVGQGQSLGMRLPGDRWIVVDGGGFAGSSFDVGERVVVPALRHLGARRLWLAASSHPHPDHLEGMHSIVRWGRPETLWLPGSFRGDDRYQSLVEEARRVETYVEWVPVTGAQLRSEEASVRAVWVPGPTENDRSLVIRVTCGGASALLPGDLETGGQTMLVESGFPLRADVLVAPHHGSLTALCVPFLQLTRPAATLISAGGRPGLPAPAFEASLQEHGSRVYGTYRTGCLHVTYGFGSVRVDSSVR